MAEEKKGNVSIFDLLKDVKGGGAEKEQERVAPTHTAAETYKSNVSSKSSSSMTTSNGFDAYEVVSAIQKMIRRGKEIEAFYWVMEMESYSSEWLWKRLMVIAIEDIGLADPGVVQYVKSMWDAYDKLKQMGKGRNPEGNLLASVVLAMCRANKNREADDLACLLDIWKKEGLSPKIPDVALDAHTRRGKAMGRDDNYWFAESYRLKHKVELNENKYEQLLKKWYREHGFKVDHPHNGEYNED